MTTQRSPDDGAPFRYSFSALKDRHNAVEVNWIDPGLILILAAIQYSAVPR